MAHVGIQGFSAGQCQDDRAQDEKALPALVLKELHGVQRIQRLEHLRVLDQAAKSQITHGQKPQDHDRAEQDADAACAVSLDREQGQQHTHGDGLDEGMQSWCADLQAFHCTEHGDSRRDQAVAVEQGCAEKADAHDPGSVTPPMPPVQSQGHQRHDAALAAIIGAHDEQYVLDGDHHGQRPEDQGQRTHDIAGAGVGSERTAEHQLHRVQRAGSDVAINHADGAHDGGNQPLRFVLVAFHRGAGVMSEAVIRRGLPLRHCCKGAAKLRDFPGYGRRGVGWRCWPGDSVRRERHRWAVEVPNPRNATPRRIASTQRGACSAN